jgi:GrpB-like predicted nucleotidyltransferase (UPF0157 family)
MSGAVESYSTQWSEGIFPSHNGRKKSKKSNLNNTFKDTEMLENILRMSNPNKSNSKLNQTLAFYRHGGHNSQVKYSNRDYLSKNSRSTKKKGLNYMKQMMNKTVLIQNQDYAVGKGAVVDFNPQQLAAKGFIKNDILVKIFYLFLEDEGKVEILRFSWL